MKQLSSFLLLIVLVGAPRARAAVVLESHAAQDTAETRALVARLEDILTQSEKRIREVFGFKLDLKAVMKPSAKDYDILYKPPESADDVNQTGILLINSRLVREYPAEDLKIAAGRALYQAIRPRFLKSMTSAPLPVRRMYDAGMTAYAAERLYPGAPPWKYAGLYGNRGKEQYLHYLDNEKDLAREVLQTRSSGGTVELDTSSRLLSYRVMKTFEREMDPKMIQLMQIAEFEQRLPGGLETLRQGFKERNPSPAEKPGHGGKR